MSNRQLNSVPLMNTCAVLLVPMSPLGSLHVWEVGCEYDCLQFMGLGITAASGCPSPETAFSLICSFSPNSVVSVAAASSFPSPELDWLRYCKRKKYGHPHHI